MFVGISPMRISFAGGGTDMPEYYEKFGGCVVSTTIDLFTNLIFNPRAGNSIQAFASDFESHQKSKKFDTKIDAFYYYPHRPDEHCKCRKPNPELIKQAALDFQINLSNS
jgi:galactokinase/mevalonate kinase-like predicted kinase